MYPEKRKKKLTAQEKHFILEDIGIGLSGCDDLAVKYSCSTSQIAGLKAYRTRLLNARLIH